MRRSAPFVLALVLYAVGSTARAQERQVLPGDVDQLRRDLLICIQKIRSSPRAAASLSATSRADLEQIATELLPDTGAPHRTATSAEVTIPRLKSALLFTSTATPPPGKVLLRDDPLGGAYDDSWQTRWVPVDKEGPFGIVYRTWQCQTCALRHQRRLRLYGPDASGIRDRANTCLATTAVATAIAAVMTGGGSIETAAGLFVACMGANSGCELTIDDEAHWTDWHNC
jgi:hypothetical protein